MPRLLENLFACAHLDNLSLVQDRDPVAKGCHRPQIVGDEQHRHVELAAQPPEQLENFFLRNRIQGAGRLIRQQERRAMQGRHGDQDPLRQPDAELPGIVPEESLFRRQAHALQVPWRAASSPPDRRHDIATLL